MSKNFNTRIKSKHDVEANWKKATNFVPYDGEIIIYDVDDTHNSPRFKIGDNSTNVNDLPFVSAETMLTIGANSFGSGIGSGIAGESFDTALGKITIDDMSDFTVNAATSAGASSIKFKIGGLSAALYYSYLEFLLENGYNGGILVIKGMVLPVISFTLSTTGSLFKSYYVTIQLMDGFTTTSDLTTTDYPTNLYAGVAYGEASQAFGTGTFAFADNSHTEGNLTRTLGDAAHAEGYLTSAEAMGAHAEGASTTASGSASHAEGGGTNASGDYSHAEGGTTEASGNYSHAEGSNTHATNTCTHAEGSGTYAIASNAHAEGMGTHAEGDCSHAEGANSYATKSFAHAEGHASQATGSSSHAEGSHTIASGDGSHAEGNSTIASGDGSHAEGNSTIASGAATHAGGGQSLAAGAISFAHGAAPQAIGSFSTAFGNQTVAASANAFVIGKFNEATKQITDETTGEITQNASDTGAVFVVGNGSGEDGTTNADGVPYSRSDAFRVFHDGTAELPTATISEIDGRGNKAVPTIEWIKDYHSKNSSGSSETVTGNYVEYKNKTNNGTYTTYDLDGTNGVATIPGNWSLGEGLIRLQGLADPQGGTEPVTKNYLDGYLASGQSNAVNIKTRSEATDLYAYQSVDESVPYLYGRYGAPNGDGTYTETEGLIKGSIGGIKTAILAQIEADAGNALISSEEADEYTTSVTIGLIPDRYRSMLDPHTIPMRDDNCAIPVGLHLQQEDESGETIEGTDELWYGGAAPASWVQHAMFYGELVPISRGLDNPNHDGVCGWDTGIQQNLEERYKTSGIVIRKKNLKAATLIDENNAEILANTGLTRLNADDAQQIGARGLYTASFGGCSSAQGERAFAEGANTIAIGKYSHAEGDNSVTLGNVSHAEGYTTTAYGQVSHAEGYKSLASGDYSHAEGTVTTADADSAHAEGAFTLASGDYAHAENKDSIASGHSSHAEGYYTKAIGDRSHTEGNLTQATGHNSHAEGNENIVSGNQAHVEGYKNIAYGQNSHAEGHNNQAGDPDNVTTDKKGNDISNMQAEHAEGVNNKALGRISHVEGTGNTTYAYASHAEGQNNVTYAMVSHVEGGGNICGVEDKQHDESNSTYSHVEGLFNTCTGKVSHVGGYKNTAAGDYQTVIGLLNINDENNVFEIGAGIDATYDTEGNLLTEAINRNAFTVGKDGGLTANFYSGNTSSVVGAQLKISGSGIDLVDQHSGNITIDGYNNVSLNTSNRFDIFAGQYLNIHGSITSFGNDSLSISSNYGTTITDETSIVISTPKATYNNSEIATMDNLISYGSETDMANATTKFFVVVE